MNIMKKLVLTMILFLLYFHPGSARDTTVVLQNGLNEYTGCVDTYLFDGYFDNSLDSNNYKDQKDLIVFWGNNGSR